MKLSQLYGRFVPIGKLNQTDQEKFSCSKDVIFPQTIIDGQKLS